MDYTILKPGAIYRLTEDVKNPHTDRRRKGSPNMEPIWKKGTRFLAREEVYEDVIDDIEIRITWFKLEFVDREHGAMYGIVIREKESKRQSNDADRAAVILAALEPAEEDFKAFIARLQLGAGTLEIVVERLCANGALTWMQIEDEYNTWMNEPDKD